MSEAVSCSAVNGDGIHGQGLGSINRESLNGGVLDGEAVATLGQPLVVLELTAGRAYMDEVVMLWA